MDDVKTRGCVHGSEEARGELFAAMAKAQQQYVQPSKSGRDPHLKRAYRDTDDCVAAALPALNANGIAVFQPPSMAQAPDTHVAVTTVIGHQSGAYIEATAESTVGHMKGLHRGQMEGASYTYLARYAFNMGCRVGVAGTDLDSAPRAEPSEESEPSESTQPEAIVVILGESMKARTEGAIVDCLRKLKAAGGTPSERQAVKDTLRSKAKDLGLDIAELARQVA